MRHSSLLITLACLSLTCCTPATTKPGISSSATSSSAAEVNAVTIALKFQEHTEASVPDTPFTRALLIVMGKTNQTIDLGNYMGSAVDTRTMSSEHDMRDALLGAKFWWAGGGDDIAVYQKGDALEVRHRTVDEESGMGEWEVLKTVELPKGVPLFVAPYEKQVGSGSAE